MYFMDVLIRVVSTASAPSMNIVRRGIAVYMDDYDRFGLGKRESNTNTTPGEDQGPERRLWLYMIKAW
ncbi:hypothetical protein BDZ89DRAFT_1070832 [Hymenopellis radicata]|nr:hypothetical protein BDZ89DRAFT_1070832 [Hymenopellis radicata]